MNFILNSMPGFAKELSPTEREYVGREAPDRVRPFLSLWGKTEETNLFSLPEIARELDLGSVLLKDEASRLGQGSFKSLGGAYALMVLFKRLLEKHLRQSVQVPQLLSSTARDFARSVTVCCATDGNHGKSVAAGARLLGCRSVIFIHAGVSQARAEAIGASEIVRVDGTYDKSVSEAERVASERGWLLVSDTSWPGYEEVPAIVAQGYTILAEEALRQAETQGHGNPTHVFLQAGVGGFASSIAGYLIDRLGRDNLKVVIVEPDLAACVFESARKGELTTVAPTASTIMAMLECYQPSLVAWRILGKTSTGFLTVTEDQARQAMRCLADREQAIVAGESGGAGLAGLQAAAKDVRIREALRLSSDSRVLLINTETATDPDSYTRIVGRTPAEVAAGRKESSPPGADTTTA